MDEAGRKMSKSLATPSIPRWSSAEGGGYHPAVGGDDRLLGRQRIGKNMLRPTRRLPQAAQHHPLDAGRAGASRWRGVQLGKMPELERLILHGWPSSTGRARRATRHSFQRVPGRCSTSWWSSCRPFYFDIRRDALYCDAPSSIKRKASVQVVRHLFDCLVKWLAPMLPFTMEEAWLDRHPGCGLADLDQFPGYPGKLEERGAGRKMAQGAAGPPRRHRGTGESRAPRR